MVKMAKAALNFSPEKEFSQKNFEERKEVKVQSEKVAICRLQEILAVLTLV